MVTALLSLCLAHAGPVEAFEAHSGARLAFEVADLPDSAWFELVVPLAPEDRDAAARIALDAARHFPPGALGEAGLHTVALFAAVGTTEDDGFHEWDEGLGGYAYFGQYDGRGAMLAAHYTDGQLPLTLHHEWFHLLDQAAGPDNARFAAAMAGEAPYEAPVLSEEDARALRRLSDGSALEGAVSPYASKSPDEDQAETARWLHSHLPAALLQVAERPGLPGSQRLLHVIEVTGRAAGADYAWLVDVALGRAGRRHPRVCPEGAWVVRGSEDEDGINWTLRQDVAELGAEALRLHDAGAALAHLGLIADYHGWIAARWAVTPGTRAAFERAVESGIVALPLSHSAVASALEEADLEDLAAVLDPGRVEASSVVGELAARGVEINPWIGQVDEELPPPWARAVRRVQPAMVRVRSGGGGASGVVVSPEGAVLTAGHAVDQVGRRAEVQLPDGTTLYATATRVDPHLDLALLRVDEAVVLPWVPLAPAPPRVGDPVAIIGQPGTASPLGRRTGYSPFHVSRGRIQGLGPDPLANQALGTVAHDAWTYWGHSGAPLLDEGGRIVAMHNSWDPETAMRHAVPWEAIRAFLD